MKYLHNTLFILSNVLYYISQKHIVQTKGFNTLIHEVLEKSMSNQSSSMTKCHGRISRLEPWPPLGAPHINAHLVLDSDRLRLHSPLCIYCNISAQP